MSDAVTRSVPLLTEAGARIALDAAVAAARSHGWAFGVAVVDPFAELIAFQRMDGANIVTIETSIVKAKSAARMGMPTVKLRDMLEAGAQSVLTIPGVVPLGGGVPIVIDGVMIGAIGVSGGTLEQDIQVAKVGRDAVTAS